MVRESKSDGMVCTTHLVSATAIIVARGFAVVLDVCVRKMQYGGADPCGRCVPLSLAGTYNLGNGCYEKQPLPVGTTVDCSIVSGAAFTTPECPGK